jgi:hypothetical protein
MISMPGVHSAEIVHPPCTEINTISKRTEMSFNMTHRHLGVPSGVLKTILEPMVHLVQTVHLSCLMISTTSKRTDMSFHLTNVT